jgi:hypothetical protein
METVGQYRFLLSPYLGVFCGVSEDKYYIFYIQTLGFDLWFPEYEADKLLAGAAQLLRTSLSRLGRPTNVSLAASSYLLIN